MGLSEFGFPRRGLMTALALMGPGLAGCSALPSMPSMPSWFTSGGSAANASAAANGPALPPDFECPPVQVRTGAATLTSSANPAEPTAMNLRYQVTIGTTARECRMGANNTVSLKVGMQGRVILGPEGGNPGSIDVPLRFAVVRETFDTNVIATRLERVAVAIPPNDTNVLFSHVSEGLEFPMPRGGNTDNYIIYIGFDPVGAEPVRKKPAPKSKPKTVKRDRPTG